MKKTWFLAVLITILGTSVANAGCKLNACDSFSWYEPNGWLQAQENGSQCWGCGYGPKSCGSGDVVPFIDQTGEIVSLWQCTFGFSNSFEKFNPGNFCSDSPIRKTNVTNAKTIYKKIGQKTTKTNIGDVDYFEGTAFCKYIYCINGYIPNSDGTTCVTDTRNAKCQMARPVLQTPVMLSVRPRMETRTQVVIHYSKNVQVRTVSQQKNQKVLTTLKKMQSVL